MAVPALHWHLSEDIEKSGMGHILALWWYKTAEKDGHICPAKMWFTSNYTLEGFHPGGDDTELLKYKDNKIEKT